MTWMRKNPKYLTAVSPYITVSSASARTPGDTFTPYSVVGVSEDYDEIRALTVEQGRFLQYVDVLRSQKVCVIGSYISKEYYNGNALGKTIGLSGYNYTIVGILSESAESRKSSADDVIIIPYTNAQQLNSALSSDTAGARSRRHVLQHGQLHVQRHQQGHRHRLPRHHRNLFG